MYKDIARNQRRTWLLLSLFLVVVIGLGWFLQFEFQAQWILPLAVGIALIQAWTGYYYADVVALASSGAISIPDEGQWKPVHRAIENAAITAGLPKPRVYLIDDPAPNAFATGRDPAHAAIAVTTGLLERLDKRELEGVLAHEMSHIGNYDIRVMSLVVVLVGIIVLASDWFLRFTFWGGGNRDRDNNSNDGSGLIVLLGIVFALLSPLFATLIQLAVSRRREFLADASGALLTRDPGGLADALARIDHDRHPLQTANKATAHLFIANPFKDGERNDARHWFVNLFDTHPPIEERIKRLRAMI